MEVTGKWGKYLMNYDAYTVVKNSAGNNLYMKPHGLEFTGVAKQNVHTKF